MKFEKDIFISYAHIDNESWRPDQPGWIASFHKALEIRLSQLMGEKPNIWRDQKLQGNDFFGDEIVNQFPKVAIIISIISPRYVKSEWCIREINSFHKIAESNIGARVGNKSRIFKVIKTPIPLEEHPEFVRDILGYDFFIHDPATSRTRELSQDAPNREEQAAYWMKLDDLAHDIAAIFNEIEQIKPEVTKTVASPKNVASEISQNIPENNDDDNESIGIYLADSSYELRSQRDSLKREFIEYGYKVYPEQILPLFIDEYESTVKESLKKCKLAIHLIGSNFGIVPEGTQDSVVVIQNQLAAEQSRQTGMPRFIWIPPGNEIKDERQEVFVDLIKIDSEVQFGADIFETPIEDLKYAVHNKIKQIKEEAEKAKQNNINGNEEDFDNQGPKQIYLICDTRDLDDIAALEDFLFDSGFEVILPVFDGDESQIRIDHQENLKLCDGTIIYHGKANQLWLRSKTRDLLKIAGYGRKKPLHAKAIFLAAPDNSDKQRFRTRDAMVINAINGFTGDALNEFTDKLK